MALRGDLRVLQNDANLSRFVVDGKRTDACRQLGTGSYGSVEEIEVNGILCAGKKIHEALLDAGNVGVQEIASKYVQECQLMSELRHPNITLFLGVCFLPNCQLPVLLMERLDGSLDDLLEAVPNIPFTLKRSMLEDIVRGLLYLHQHNPQIVHRDLTAKNVLLTSSLTAKITDFGNSRIVILEPGQLAQTMSRLPGTMVYMPPEALSASTRYGSSLDIFSFGHLALYTLIQVFPGKLLESTYPDPRNPDQILGRSEVERRREWIDLLEKEFRDGEQHPLTQMVKQCLQNEPARRPTTEQLLTSLKGMRDAIEGPYGKFSKLDAVRQVTMTRELVGQDIQMRRVTSELALRTEEVQQLRQQLEDAATAHRLELQQKDIEHQRTTSSFSREIHQLRDSLESIRVRMEEMCNETEIDQLQRGLTQCLAQLRRALGSADDNRESQPQDGKTNQTPLSTSIPILEWRRAKDMPSPMEVYPEAVVIKGKVYVGGGTVEKFSSGTVMVYDIKHDDWSILPKYDYFWFSMTTVNNQLVLVGGTANERTNLLGVWNEESQKWAHPFPPMNQMRSGATVVTYNNRWMAVAGGFDGKYTLNSVELLDIDAGKWFHCTPLPESHKQYKLSSVIIGNMWYLANVIEPVAAEGVLCAPLDDLIATTVSLSIENPAAQLVWRVLPTCATFPLEGSAATALNGALVVVGGGDDRSKCLSVYQPESQSWIKVGEMPIGRYQCTCAILPDGELFVVGGNGNTSNNCQVSIAKPKIV